VFFGDVQRFMQFAVDGPWTAGGGHGRVIVGHVARSSKGSLYERLPVKLSLLW
jgi:hypothetical protein